MGANLEAAFFLRLIRKWFWLLLAATFIPPVGAALVSSRLPPVYEASATVLMHPGRSAGTEPGYYLTIDQMGRTIARLMTRRQLLAGVIKGLDLSVSPSQLSRQLSVVPDPNSQIIAVKVRDSDPNQAARIANKLVEDYLALSNAEQEAQFGTALQGLQSRINDLDKQIKQTQLQIVDLQNRSRLTPEQQGQLAALQTKLNADSALYSTLIRNYEEIRGSQATRMGTVSQVEAATPPTKTVGPRLLLRALAGLVLGLMAGVGLAILLDYLDNTIKAEEDVRQILDVPTLGVLPLLTTPGSELLALTAPLSPIVEAYRGIRTNVLFADVDTPLRTLLVTSSLAGEGKTRIAANLAIVMAQAGRRVILVDADFRRPRLPEIFRRIDTRGVTNLLLEGGNADGFLWPTEVPGLRLLCTGPLPLNPSEITGSRRMIELIAHLRECSDLVIFDSPPLHAVTDPAILASRLEGTILVVHAGRTSRTLVRQAGESLHKVGARLLGVVLNKVKDAHQIPYSEYYASSTSPDQAAHAMAADEPFANAAATSASAQTERVEIVR